MSEPAIFKELNPLFNPRSVAVVGASNNRNKWGYSTFASIKRQFPGDLYAVNHRDPDIMGSPTFATLKDIPGPVDLVVIVVPPEHVAGVMKDSVEKGVKAGVIITAGFAEVGAEGKKMQDEVVAIARTGGIRLVGPNCMGMWSASGRLPAFMFPMTITDGPLALVSQGGNIGGALVADATARGIGFRYYVSCGCTADIPMEDYIEYMGHDDAVGAILLYIEGLKVNNRFVEKVSRVTRKKPVIALKPGRTDAAARAISSHSGAMSGLDDIYHAAFKKAGVIRAESSTEMLDVGIGFLTQALPRGRRVVITTPGGSYGVMCAEACALRGLDVIDLPRQAMDIFNTMFPDRWSHGNPVDPAGDRDFIQYLRAPEILLQCEEVDALIFMGFGSFSGISSVFTGGRAGPEILKWLKHMDGFDEMAGLGLNLLRSGDRSLISEVLRPIITHMFRTVMPTKDLEMGDFLDTLTEALTTDRMLKSSFYRHLTEIFTLLAEGRTDGLGEVGLLDLMEPMIGALVNGLISKYGKPVITTTFTEENTRISEAGHFPYPNTDRAATVLAKLVEYREYLDQAAF